MSEVQPQTLRHLANIFSTAADSIERLRNEPITPAPAWTNADESMPTAGVDVIAFTSGGRMLIRRVQKHKFTETYDKVTHWMYLPEPPTQ